MRLATEGRAERSFNLHESRCATWGGRADTAVNLWTSYVERSGEPLPSVWEIADIGCGDEKLRGPLERTGQAFRYHGYDKLPQTRACQPLDLVNEVPDRTFDLAFCLGVMEYLPDPPGFLRRLRSISPRLVVSYVIADARAYRPEEIASRGWLHSFSSDELEAMFRYAGFDIRRSAVIDEGRTGMWLLEAGSPPNPFGSYSILTPHPIPDELRQYKVPNLGDGFIELSVKRLLGEHPVTSTHSTRRPLTSEAREAINRGGAVAVVGANQLNDRYSILPELTERDFGTIRIPVAPCGMGIHGIASFNQRMSEQTRTLLLAMHDRLTYSSWRCTDTLDYLLQNCPELAGKALMTGCPVTYGEPLLLGQPFSTRTDRIVVTVTERDDFWNRETQTLDFVARRFPKSQRILSLHQVYPRSTQDDRKLSLWERLSGRTPKTAARLAEYARARGYQVFAARSPEEGQAFYNGCDLHVGSRLHAHLYFLSQAKRSFLSAVDGRSVGMARTLGFPLCEPSAWDRYFDYDFEQCRTTARVAYQSMARFVWSLKEKLG